MAAPTILDDNLKEKICLLLRAGCTARRAAALVGVDESTLRKAADRDERFRQQLQDAVIELEIECLDGIRQGKRAWRGNVWLLERLSDAYAPSSGDSDPDEQLLVKLLAQLPFDSTFEQPPSKTDRLADARQP